MLCFSRKEVFSQKGDKLVGILLRDTLFVCEKDPVKEKKGQQLVNVAYIVKRRKKKRILGKV